MKRDLTTLVKKEYDLIIVGAGAFGTCAAWDAASRGLAVALVDQRDFCSGTSAQHYKMVHGGMRYLQHADFHRVRESCHERSALLRIAPHLVHPLPIVIPTYGHGTKGKGFLRAGFTMYDLLTLDRNLGIPDPARRIQRGRFISRREILDLFPGVKVKELTGGAIFSDGQYYNPPRLALSFIKSAVTAGADVANYLEVTEILQNQNRVSGVKVKDAIGGGVFDIRAKMLLVTAGPWSHRLLQNQLNIQLNPVPTFSRDLGFVIKRRLSDKYCLACQLQSEDKDSLVDRGGRHIFLAPWRGYTLVGVWHKVFNYEPETVSVSEEELQRYINEVNDAYPDLAITMNDVTMINTGLTLFGEESAQGQSDISFGKRSRLIDHEQENTLKGLITLIGVRATTARGMAEQAIDLVMKKLSRPAVKSSTDTSPIYGGNIDIFKDFLANASEENQPGINGNTIYTLVRSHGSRYKEVLKYLDKNPSWSETIGGSSVIKAEVIHAAREEMAMELGDVVFRRTDLATAEHPGEKSLQTCAELMAGELGWDREKTTAELDEVKRTCDKRGFIMS